jgi:hypothetical protein
MPWLSDKQQMLRLGNKEHLLNLSLLLKAYLLDTINIPTSAL